MFCAVGRAAPEQDRTFPIHPSRSRSPCWERLLGHARTRRVVTLITAFTRSGTTRRATAWGDRAKDDAVWLGALGNSTLPPPPGEGSQPNKPHGGEDDVSVDSIILDIDSPGGTIYGVQELADAIYKARDRKPIYGDGRRATAGAMGSDKAFGWASRDPAKRSVGDGTVVWQFERAETSRTFRFWVRNGKVCTKKAIGKRPSH